MPKTSKQRLSVAKNQQTEAVGHSALLRGFRWPSVEIHNIKCRDWHRMSEAVALTNAESWPWGSQVAYKKVSYNRGVFGSRYSRMEQVKFVEDSL